MSRPKFQPTGFDALEDRLALTAFAVPFAIVSSQPSSEVNPKFLVLTKHAETQVSYAITASFNRFTHSATLAEAAYQNGIAKPGANATVLFAQLSNTVNDALIRLTSDLDKVARKIPFGGQNLSPILKARIEGAAGVTDTTTKVNTPSLQFQLATAFQANNQPAQLAAIQSTQTLVRADVTNYIHLGVTNGDFKLGRGALLPPLS